MGAVATAINEKNDGIAESVSELQARRDLIMGELTDFTVIPPHGGWSLLVDVSPLGIDGPTASRRLLEQGQIAATAMVNWGGDHCDKYVRLVFSNESSDRLRGLGDRFRRALT
jgi:aspartate/methionine/tyrosine aminotransferase